jgi:hypothetical protein
MSISQLATMAWVSHMTRLLYPLYWGPSWPPPYVPLVTPSWQLSSAKLPSTPPAFAMRLTCALFRLVRRHWWVVWHGVPPDFPHCGPPSGPHWSTPRVVPQLPVPCALCCHTEEHRPGHY